MSQPPTTTPQTTWFASLSQTIRRGAGLVRDRITVGPGLTPEQEALVDREDLVELVYGSPDDAAGQEQIRLRIADLKAEVAGRASLHFNGAARREEGLQAALAYGFCTAVGAGKTMLADVFLAAGATPSVAGAKNPMESAVDSKQTRVVDYIARTGLADARGLRVGLLRACAYSEAAMIDRLVAAGADMTLDGSGALAVAAAGQRAELVAKLLSLGAPRSALYDVTLKSAITSRQYPFTDDVRATIKTMFAAFADDEPLLCSGVKAVLRSYDMHAKLMSGDLAHAAPHTASAPSPLRHSIGKL